MQYASGTVFQRRRRHTKKERRKNGAGRVIEKFFNLLSQRDVVETDIDNFTGLLKMQFKHFRVQCLYIQSI